MVSPIRRADEDEAAIDCSGSSYVDKIALAGAVDFEVVVAAIIGKIA